MPRILVIDDDDMVRSTIKAILERAGHEVTLAVDGEDGLRQFQRQGCDLVVCDIFMPNKEGIATLRELRHLDAAVPVITMTGGSPSAGRTGPSAYADYLNMSTLLGATRTIHKPFRASELIALVQECLDEKKPPAPPSPGGS
jgi:DNA-binding response OmpR family regulator